MYPSSWLTHHFYANVCFFFFWMIQMRALGYVLDSNFHSNFYYLPTSYQFNLDSWWSNQQHVVNRYSDARITNWVQIFGVFSRWILYRFLLIYPKSVSKIIILCHNFFSFDRIDLTDRLSRFQHLQFDLYLLQNTIINSCDYCTLISHLFFYGINCFSNYPLSSSAARTGTELDAHNAMTTISSGNVILSKCLFYFHYDYNTRIL